MQTWNRRMLALALGVTTSSSGHAATLNLLDLGNRLVSIDSTAPGTIRSSIALTGLQGNEQLLSIDYRPASPRVLYGLGSAGGILSAIGTLSANPTLSTLGRVANTIMPTNALWLGASYHLQPELLLQAGQAMRGANPFFGSEPVSAGMVAWAAALTALAVAAGMWRFSRRDL